MPANPLPRLRANIPATSTDAENIRNAVYQISTGAGSMMTFRVSTITQARTTDLVGKRVVSRMLSTGDWQMFAFLTQSGELKLWQRFRNDSGRPYVIKARLLLEFLAEYGPNDDSYSMGGNHAGSIRVSDRELTISYTSLCQVCNGRIVARDNRCAVHTTVPVAAANFTRTFNRDAEPFEVVGSLVVNVEANEIEVPRAILARLPHSEITPTLIR